MADNELIEHKAIYRTFWYDSKENIRVLLSQDDLLQRSESIVILGEAGMGKSYLLERLAKTPGYARCTARQLINRAKPQTLLGDARVLLIDALDEVSTQQGVDAVDQVLRKLGELDYPNFVLSCRVADWRSATGVETIQEQYADKPLELHLEPFSDDDAIEFLGSRLGFDTARTVVEHFNTRKLHGLLGNPQTLEMIVNVANKGPLPETRGALFASAIDVLLNEHKDAKQACQPAKEVGLDAAGAAFAGLILTGSEALVRKAAASVAEGELLLADIALLPGGKAIEAVLGTRLFKADGTDRFSYWHRRIGEFLAARWLAKNADTQRKRRRLIALFHTYGLVPSNLRGLHAWLARDPSLAMQVIAADPMGVVEYGDADDLSLVQARALINALKLLAADNPNFRDWGIYSIRGIVQVELINELRDLITHPDTPFGLRLLVLEAIKGAKIASDLSSELRMMVLDDTASFANRSAAVEVLVDLANGEDWTHISRTLHGYGNDLSIRLAVEISDKVGYDYFDDELIVDLIISHTRINNHTVGILMRMQEYLPESRLEGILGRLVSTATRPDDSDEMHEIADFASHLILRRVTTGDISPESLWLWLEPFDRWTGYQRTSRQQLDRLIRSNDSLRRGVQRLVLLEKNNSKSITQRAFCLGKRAQSLIPTSLDVLALLKILDPANRSDERWRNIINLVDYQGDAGAKIREAALPFAAHRHDLQIWINKPRVSQLEKLQIHNKNLEHRQRVKHEAKYAKHRQNFTAHIHQMYLGDSNRLIPPAKAYLNLFYDLDKTISAHERIAYWLGDELADAAYSGFETFLNMTPPSPSAKEIADSLAKGKYWQAACIIVVALAERFRRGVGFNDLSDERLMAGFLELRRSKVDEDEAIVALTEVLATTLHTREIWSAAMRLYYEPQFEARLTYVDALHELMSDDRHTIIVTELADDWLQRFPQMPHAPELELMVRLLRSGEFDKLRYARERFTDSQDDERRRNWDSIGLLVDCEKTVARIEISKVEPELLWNLQVLIGKRAADGTYIVLSTSQLEWIIATFRAFWPHVHHPTGTYSGDKNGWDASDHLIYLIRRLASEASNEAIASLQRLKNAPDDGYTETIKSVAAEQARIRVEVAYTPPTLDAIHAIVLDSPPLNTADLRAFMMEELLVVQTKIKSDDAESWRGFYDNNTAWDEERCRDHLLGLLRQGSKGVALEPESHVAADKEVDITCSVGTLRIPIEIKGQWHPQLWHSADRQLDALYTQDWRASGHGIYLVLWFGGEQPENKRLKSPGKSRKRPQNPEELCQMLTASSEAASEGRVMIFVLDLARP